MGISGWDTVAGRLIQRKRNIGQLLGLHRYPRSALARPARGVVRGVVGEGRQEKGERKKGQEEKRRGRELSGKGDGKGVGGKGAGAPNMTCLHDAPARSHGGGGWLHRLRLVLEFA